MVEHPCSSHPDAPHGFVRNSSHTLDRYVCTCEGWVPPEENKVNQYLYEIEPEDDEEYYDSDFDEPDDGLDEDALEQAAFERSP